MDIITVDYETHYSTEYSLTRLTTEQYIRDGRFEVIGVSAKLNDEPGQWFSGTKKQTKEFLMQFDWDNLLQIAHNNLFDAAISGWKFGIHPKMLGCTMAMARAIHISEPQSLSLASLAKRYGLGEKGHEVFNNKGLRRADFDAWRMERYGEYCLKDGDLCYGLFNEMAPLLPVSELRLIDTTLRMFAKPSLELDVPLLEGHLIQLRKEKERLLAQTSVSKDVLMSNEKLAQLYISMGVTPPTKRSPTTGKYTWAFAKSDPGFQALLEHDNTAVQFVTAARLGVKSTLEETRTERLIEIGQRGKMPVPLRYAAAHTLRWGGEDKINLQNLPRKSIIKKAIKAPDDYTIVDCDSSQIEARILAWLAEEEGLVEAFAKNNEEIARGVPKAEMKHDPYKLMAADIYGMQLASVSDDMRFVGKWTILGCGYGMGHSKFQMQLKAQGIEMDLNDCRGIVNAYRRKFPRIAALWKQGDRVLEALMKQKSAKLGRDGVLSVNLLGIRFPNNTYMRYENLRVDKDPRTNLEEIVYDSPRGKAQVRTHIYGGKVVENVTQMLARHVVGEQMLMIGRRYQPVLTVHDAVAALAPDAEVVEARKFIETCMRIRPKWAAGLPLNCESRIGKTYG